LQVLPYRCFMTPRVATHRDIVVFNVNANDQLLQYKSQSFISTEGHLTLKNEQTLSESRTKFRLKVEQKYKTLPQEKKVATHYRLMF
jgi:hypothetical protein